MESYLNNRRHPVDVAIEILKSKFPNASIGFVAGSFQRGEATTSSDIEIYLLQLTQQKN